MIWLVLPWDGPARLQEFAGELEEMQALVGGWIERVPLEGDDGDGSMLWCNEEYGLQPEFAEQKNALATALVRQLSPYTAIGFGGFLGNCFVTGAADPETTGVPVRLVRYLNRIAGVRGLDGELLADWWPYESELAYVQAGRTVGAMIGKTPMPVPEGMVA
jgi:hypothetical protein